MIHVFGLISILKSVIQSSSVQKIKAMQLLDFTRIKKCTNFETQITVKFFIYNRSYMSDIDTKKYSLSGEKNRQHRGVSWIPEFYYS